MKAIIMAGGEGTRLRPITCRMPKPAVPVKDKPIILHIIELLEKHGIYDIAITLKYLPGEIKKIVESAVSCGNVKADIKFCTETSPLGTAGSVKNCISECYGNSEEDFLIISGDAMTDIDLRDMIAFHKKFGKMATIAVKPVDVPTEFGVVLTNKENMVTGFIEKPVWSEAVSNIVNTGIYIVTSELMELCPQGTACDFAKDIFTKVPDLSQNIAAYQTTAFWCDIGDIRSYRSVNLKDGGFIGENCNISDEADIQNSVICHGCSVGAGSVITGSVLMPNTVIGKHCKISESVLCPSVSVEDAVSAEDAVIGEKAVIGHSVLIKKGTKIWDNANILPESMIHGVIREYGGSASSYSPEMVLRLGRAFGTFLGQHASAVICADGSGSSCMISAGLQAALASVGILVKIMETVPMPVVRWICRSGICDGAVYVSDNGESHIHFLNKFGDDLSKNERRKLKSIYDREDFTRVDRNSIPVFEELSNPEDYYISALLDIFKCPHKNLNYIGRRFTKSQRYAAAAYLTIKMFPDAPIFLAASESMAAEKIAEKFDRYVIRCGSKIGDIMSEMEKFMHIDGVYAEYLMFFDDLAFDLGLCCIDGLISGEFDTEIEELIKIPVYRSEAEINCKNANKADIIRKFVNSDLARRGFEINDGICIRDNDYSARICADEERQAFHVYVESMSEEYGKDIAGEILRTLENLLT
ncbi:MAG: sugar phosphate nucleotidyltransferase [Clostridia bacterium]